MKKYKGYLNFSLLGIIISFFTPWFNVVVESETLSFSLIGIIQKLDYFLVNVFNVNSIDVINEVSLNLKLLFLIPILSVLTLILSFVTKKIKVYGIVNGFFSIFLLTFLLIKIKYTFEALDTQLLDYISMNSGFYFTVFFILGSIILSIIADKTVTYTRQSTRDLVLSGLFIALVFVVTYSLQFHLPVSINSGGLIHLGNIPLFAIAIAFGKKKGAIAGGIGMGLFDLLSPYAIWAPCTFVVRGLQGYIIGYISNRGGRNGNSVVWNIVAVIISTVWMLAGYFGYNLLLYRNLAGALSGIPGDLIQTVLGIVGMFGLLPVLKMIKKRYA